MTFEVDDEQARPLDGRIGQDVGQHEPAIGGTAIVTNGRRAMGQQHPRQQMR
ncbi:hypothetical protein D3C72_2596100 [compost metagenome]